MNLWKFYGHDVKITFTDGTTMEGLVEFYTSATDNEPDPESITMRNKRTGLLTELYAPEIERVELI